MTGRLTPRPVVWWTLALGAAAGIAYTAAPVTMLMLAALAGLQVLAGRGLDKRERRWVVRLFALAIVTRVLVIAGVFVVTNPQREAFWSLFGDGQYVITRSLWIRDYWLGGRLAPDVSLNVFDPYGGEWYYYVFAFVQTVFGPAPYGLNLFTIFFTGAGALALHRLVRHAYGPAPAMIVFVLLLFVPTIFSWSVSMLKEALFLLFVTTSVGAVFWLVRGTGLRRVAACGAGIVALLGLAELRAGGMEMAAGGALVGVLGWVVAQHRWMAMLAIPVALAAGAALTVPAVSDRVTAQIQLSANRHMGHVATEGHGYKLLDAGFYPQGPEATSHMSAAEMARFLVRSVVSFVVVPLPTQLRSRSEWLFLPQQLMWYAMVLLAVPGAVLAFRRESLLTCLLLGYVAVAIAVIGPNSGNIGTLVRHRDMVLPFVGCLGAVGLCGTLSALVRVSESMPRRQLVQPAVM